MIRQNREGHDKYNIPDDWATDRTPGVSAMLRVGNEEEWIGPCLESIREFFDEIIITLDCDDRTDEIIDSFDDEIITVHEYPFEINPNGPGHSEYPADSVHDRAYYYNWTLAQTTRTHVCKWDADMLLRPKFCTEEFYDITTNNRVVFTKGWEIVSETFNYVSESNPTTGSEPRFFRVSEDLHYVQGELCENFMYPSLSQVNQFPKQMVHRAWNVITGNEYHVDEPTYFHTKHIKSSDKQAWPDNWEEMDHFQRIDDRKTKGKMLDVDPPSWCFKSPDDYLK